MYLVYWKLELKRAYQRFPQMLAGAIALLFLAGAIALLAGRALYGDAAVSRVTVGVTVPGDALSRQMVSMISSLDSVKSLCDFQYLEREECLKGLQDGRLNAVMDLPEGLIQGIMEGSNPPVRVLLPKDAWLESRIFKELTEAGARTLGASQAGIYAGNELCLQYGLESAIPKLEQDLNQIYLSYSLPREDYFRHLRVSATGDVGVPVFYGISAYVLFLLLLTIPVSGYLLPFTPVMRQKLTLAGAGNAGRAWGRIVGLGSLFFVMTFLMGALIQGLCLLWDILPGEHFSELSELPGTGKAAKLWEIQTTARGSGMGFGAVLSGAVSVLTLLLVCLAAAALVALIYQAAGSLLGGIMLLFLTVTAQHFLAGGFLPAVFLPKTLQQLAPGMPSAVLMAGVQMALTKVWSLAVVGRLLALLLVCFLLTVLFERRER